MIDLWQLLKDDAAVQALNSHTEGLSSLTPGAECLVIATAFRQKPRNIVVVKNNLYTAQQLYRKLTPLLQEDVLLFSVEESLRVEAYASTPTMYAGQMETLTHLILEDRPRVIVTHPLALVKYLPTAETFRRHILNIKVGQTIKMNEFREKLVTSGYKMAARVDQPLTFSVRGDVVDVFSIQEARPTRIEFFDDEIDSIRYFDMSTQRTVAKAENALIVPASIMIYEEDFDAVEKRIRVQLERDLKRCDFPDELENNVSRDIEYLRKRYFEHYLYRYRCFFAETGLFLDYVSEPDIILSTAIEGMQNYENVINETADFIREIFGAGNGLAYFSVFADYRQLLVGKDHYEIGLFADYRHPIQTSIKPFYFSVLPLDKMTDEILKLAQNYTVILALPEGSRKMIADIMYQRGILAEDVITFMDEIFEEGFECGKVIVMTARELFGTNIRKGRYSRKFNEAIQLDDYQDLNPGDYVVHNQYGIGKYQGIVTREMRGFTVIICVYCIRMMMSCWCLWNSSVWYASLSATKV